MACSLEHDEGMHDDANYVIRVVDSNQIMQISVKGFLAKMKHFYLMR